MKNADRIARIVFKANINGGKINESNVMPPVAQAIKSDFPEVEDATRLGALWVSQKVTYKDKVFKDDRFALADPNFFNVFTLPLIEGDAKTALQATAHIDYYKRNIKKIFW